jgi:transcriptional regulator with PAS, ATPase and Fis domain
VITLPPLAERQADLPDLTERMLQRANGLDERRVVGLSPEAWEFMRAYRWPGNLRELYTVLVSARSHAVGRPVGAGERIEASDLPAYLRQAVNLERTSGPAPTRPLPLDQLLQEAEKRLIQLALRRSGGKYNRAAELLGIPRQRLWRRMKEFGLAEGEENP